jgi:hypothetical protein
MLVTLLDAQRDIDNQKARYQQVAGRVSILREALHRANAEIRRIYEAVEAEEDGAEVLLKYLPEAKSNRSMLESRLDPLEAEERMAIRALESYGINVA